MDKVTEKTLDKLVDKLIFIPLLSSLGYEYLRGVFYREIPSGVRHLIILDYNSIKRVFYIILGLNSRVVSGDTAPDEAGAYVSNYLSPGGINPSPQAYRAFKTEVAESSIIQVRQDLERYGLPWLQKYILLSDFANALDKQYDFFKGKLFLAECNYREAEKWFGSYERRLLQMPSDKQVTLALQETRDFIRKCQEGIGA